MNPTRQLHDLGQSVWLDNITRQWLDDGTLGRYIQEYSVTGLTSNPTIFDKVIAGVTRFAAAGVDIDELAAHLQREVTRAFTRSWHQLLERIGDKGTRLASSALKPSTSTAHRHG